MSRRTLLILLFVSLALNLFILGAGAGAFLFGERLFPHRQPQFRGGPPMFAAASTLPDAEAQAYRDALSAQALAVRPRLREARMLRHDAWTKLGADPVDPAGVVADLDKARAMQAQAQSEVDKKIVEFAAKLPATERRRFAAAMAEPPQRRGGRGQGPPPPDQPPFGR
ncbi:periplasmic heavy metal sensor [Phenylobacterium sp.]|uniref:periplasmic heavy metal sensor n=1 Tax=Phenylobacterium sp. TaxID=1871053 RepID=UPI002DE967CA|nr:periplasmic heavy metal sensor [Phenylobacterium sp.]